ncbi:hypothetical protein Nepgr_024135 [Nepenthes gracilis]|uniref:VQ domain-containing protein n=1 Tax=Nepenthes gracilis TaxID=150966 RepID=A0AAD3T5C5_NEPGR|nr:hypothetical protein Nepgr_024135 [Nepenthes gracilis]
MADSGTPAGQPPRKELQGPRPAPLKVRKDSYKIKKPPVAPTQPQQQPPQQPPKPPVIIYTVSPKVIHTKPADFMSLVQRLTGSNSASSSATASSSSWGDRSDAISPAARFASIEKTKVSPEGKKAPNIGVGVDGIGFDEDIQGVEMGFPINRTGNFPGILSPVPGSLLPVSPNLFSPYPDRGSSGLYHDLNAVQAHHGITSSFLASPSANFFSPSTTMFSPSSLEFLSSFFNAKDDKNFGF